MAKNMAAEIASLVARDRPERDNGGLRKPSGNTVDPGHLITLLTESTDKIHDYALAQMKTAKSQIEEAASEALSKIDDIVAVIEARREATHQQFREYVSAVTSACRASDELLLTIKQNTNRVLTDANATGAAVMSMPVPEPSEPLKTVSIASDHEAIRE